MNAIQFTNTMGKVYLTGAKILEMLEKAVYRYDGKTRRGEFLQMSGKQLLNYLSLVFIFNSSLEINKLCKAHRINM